MQVRIVLLSLNLIATQGLFMIAILIAESVIKAIIDLQTH
jgi:hypothetical protein